MSKDLRSLQNGVVLNVGNQDGYCYGHHLANSPAFVGHLVAAEMDGGVREEFHHFGKQTLHERVGPLEDRVDRAVEAVRSLGVVVARRQQVVGAVAPRQRVTCSGIK